MPLRITWIAPVSKNLPALAWLNELERIGQIPGVTVSTRTGDAITISDVAGALGIPADILIWSGHGTNGGLVLSDGVTLVRPRWLASQISLSTKPKVAILAACGSQGRDLSLRSLTETICRNGINVVGFPAEAVDSVASTFIVEYVRAVAINASVVVAFDVALESINESTTAQGVFFTPGAQDVAFDLDLTLREIVGNQDKMLALLGVRKAGGEEQAEESPPGNILPMAHRPAAGHVRGIGRAGNGEKTA